VAAGATVMDPEVVAQLVAGRRSPLGALSAREREVLSRMAEGHANADIARLLFITEPSVSMHIGNIFAKLGLPASDAGHRRVTAVLTYLNEEGPTQPLDE
jgi:DNA-binding CsgD family transcriptional regulator